MRLAVIVISALFAILFVFLLYDIENSTARFYVYGLTFIMVCYSIVRIFNSIYSVSFKKYSRFSTQLTVGLSALLFASFLTYFYYNVFAAICLSVLLAIIVYISIKEQRTNFEAIIFLLLVLITVVIPKDIILRCIRPSQLSFERKIEFDDFKGTPDKNKPFDALIYTELRWMVNKAYNYPPAIIEAFMFPKKSWVKREKLTNPKVLLNHELGHFVITENLRKIAVEKTQKAFGSPPEVINQIIYDISATNNMLDNIYDYETNHGLDTSAQRLWDKSSFEIVKKYVAQH